MLKYFKCQWKVKMLVNDTYDETIIICTMMITLHVYIHEQKFKSYQAICRNGGFKDIITLLL